MAGTSVVSIRQSPEAPHAVEPRVEANNRFPVIPAKARDPVIILPQAMFAHLPVEIGCRFGNAVVQPVNGPAPGLEIMPSLLSRGKGDRDLA